MKCEYGCDKDAKHQLKNGKWCCESSANSCPEMKRKNSRGLKSAYSDGRRERDCNIKNRNWSNGKTALNDNRIRSKYINPEDVLINDRTFCGTVKMAFKFCTEYKCHNCGNEGIWDGKPLSLHIHHIDGNKRNNTKENLQYLCPNCHTQTDNYGSKNITGNHTHTTISDENFISALMDNYNISSALKSLGLRPFGGNYTRAIRLVNDNNIEFKPTPESNYKKNKYCECGKSISRTATRCKSCTSKLQTRKIENRPSKEILLADIEALGYLGTGRKYGVSDNCIRKWLKSN